MNFRDFFTTHTWWGKLLGAFFGFLAAGPLGSFLGLLLGNFFDRGLAAHFNPIHSTFYDEKRKHVQDIFLETTFTIMGHIAKADGRVSEAEINLARLMMQEMRLSRAQKKRVKHYFNQGKASSYNIIQHINLLLNYCRDNPELLKLFIEIQYRVAKVDGLSNNKIQILDKIFKHMGLASLYSQYRYQQDYGSYNSDNFYNHDSYKESNSKPQENISNSLAQAFALLEIPPTSNKKEVKHAYRRIISRNHPDKLIAQGASEASIKTANDKSQKISKAYEFICQMKGW